MQLFIQCHSAIVYFMSIIYLFCCATQFVWTSSPVSAHTSFGLPPARSPIKFLSALHSASPPTPPCFPADVRIPSSLRCSPGLLPQPRWLPAPQCLMVYSTVKLHFSFPSLSFFPSPFLLFPPLLLNQRPVNRSHFGSLVLFAANLKTNVPAVSQQCSLVTLQGLSPDL